MQVTSPSICYINTLRGQFERIWMGMWFPHIYVVHYKYSLDIKTFPPLPGSRQWLIIGPSSRENDPNHSGHRLKVLPMQSQSPDRNPITCRWDEPTRRLQRWPRDLKGLQKLWSERGSQTLCHVFTASLWSCYLGTPTLERLRTHISVPWWEFNTIDVSYWYQLTVNVSSSLRFSCMICAVTSYSE